MADGNPVPDPNIYLNLTIVAAERASILQTPHLHDSERARGGYGERVEKKFQSEILPTAEYPLTSARSQETIPWRYGQNRSFQHHSYGPQTDHYPHCHCHPSYHHILARSRRKQEVWRYRMVERTADQILVQEEVLVEGGSSGCIHTRQHSVATGRPRADTGFEDGRRWLRWMGPGVVCSSRR